MRRFPKPEVAHTTTDRHPLEWSGDDTEFRDILRFGRLEADGWNEVDVPNDGQGQESTQDDISSRDKFPQRFEANVYEVKEENPPAGQEAKTYVRTEHEGSYGKAEPLPVHISFRAPPGETVRVAVAIARRAERDDPETPTVNELDFDGQKTYKAWVHLSENAIFEYRGQESDSYAVKAQKVYEITALREDGTIEQEKSAERIVTFTMTANSNWIASKKVYVYGIEPTEKLDELKLVVWGEEVIDWKAKALLAQNHHNSDNNLVDDLPIKRWYITDEEPVNVSYAYKLDLSADEPFLDKDAEVPGAPVDQIVHVPADTLTDMYGKAGGPRLGINLITLVERKGASSTSKPFDDEKFLEEWDFEWEVEEDGGNEGAKKANEDAGFDDLNVGGVVSKKRKLTTKGAAADNPKLENGVSRVHLFYDFGQAFYGQPWVRAGDKFNIKVTATHKITKDVLNDKIQVIIVPGKKLFHVSTDSTTAAQDNLAGLSANAWKKTDAQFETEFGNYQFVQPEGSGNSKFIQVFLFDQYRNLLEADLPVFWKLEGGGHLGNFDPAAQNPNADGELTDAVDGNGSARILLTQERFANCPWQRVEKRKPSLIFIGVDGRISEANASLVKRDEPLPGGIPEIELYAAGHNWTDAGEPDIRKKDRITFTITILQGGEFVKNAEVGFTSLNGRLEVQNGGKTDNQGVATAILTHVNAVEGEIDVIAGITSKRMNLNKANSGNPDIRTIRWVTSSETKVKVDHRILVGDATQNGWVAVDTLNDKGESAPYANPIFSDIPLPIPAMPSAPDTHTVSPDGKLWVPYWTRTKVTVDGLPNHTYKVDIIGSNEWRLTARYPFDEILSNTTPDTVAGRNATTSGQVVDTNIKAEGVGSLQFSGTSTVSVPNSPAVDLLGGLHGQIWLRTTATTPCVVLERAGQFKLELLADQKVRWTVTDSLNNNHQVTTTAPIDLGEWNLLDFRFDGTSIRIGVGTDSEALDAEFSIIGSVTPSTSTSTLTIGQNFVGRLDDLQIRKGGHQVSSEVTRFGFESIAPDDTTPDDLGGPSAVVVGAVLTNNSPADGSAALRFDGDDGVSIPSNSNINLAAEGVKFEAFIKPNAASATIFERSGQYKLELLSDRKLRFTVHQANSTTVAVTSTSPVALDEWSLISAEYASGKLIVGHGSLGAEFEEDMQSIGNDSVASSSSALVLGANFVGELDRFSIVRGGQAPSGLIAEGLSIDGTITTDANGHAEFFVKVNGNFNPTDIAPETYELQLSGSLLTSIKISKTMKWLWGGVVNAAKAFIAGPDELGADATWLEKAVAWAGEVIPFVSDLKELGKEIYKAASGCDEVSWMNVTFSVVGIIADAVSFGQAGRVVKLLSVGAKQFFKVTAKVFLREMAQNIAMTVITRAAISGYVELATKYPDHPWVVQSQKFVEGVTTWVQDAGSNVKRTVNEALRSTSDCFIWMDLYNKPGYGPTQVRRVWDSIEAVSQ